MEVHGGARTYLQPVEGLTLEQGNVPEGDPRGKPMVGQTPGGIYGLMERGSHAGAGLLAGVVTLQGLTLEQSVPEGPMMEHFMKNCT